ncbi:uncharacterized protein LOC114417135 [Glycine soja]|uniref:Uncharacterized protein n=1 Tax=Glycine soja TaxID=3848 RepID=A0A0B2PEQ8_GLYSO|nr:uncharacterized protein LOC114417135 [Glycine soja]KHN07755.1 hypothetical protein glysoja_033841 [Glycine soja]RZC09546.1 hypothetical protein D0Y65_016050 [Glycine soja]
MITMDVKGIRWVGNMYQKFENMFLEAEDVMYEDTVKYIENQMQTVGESVKKLYSEIVGDLLPPGEKVSIELPIDKCADAGLYKKPFHVYKERHVKADTKQTTEDSRIVLGVDNVARLASSTLSLRNSVKESNFSSPSRQYVRRMDVISNLGIDENPVNKKMAVTNIINETTLAETVACRTSQSCEISNENENQNHGVTVSKPASAKVARLASDTDCSNEIEDASTKQFPNVPQLVKAAEEKPIDKSSSSCVPFGEPVEQGHKTMQEDHLKLEEACVMVNGDEIQLPPKAGGNLNTKKKKARQTFSLSKKSARKQEYKELAAWHMNSEKVKGDCMENLDPTLPQDNKKLLLPSMSEPEWELL